MQFWLQKWEEKNYTVNLQRRKIPEVSFLERVNLDLLTEVFFLGQNFLDLPEIEKCLGQQK